jgi:hypothetical protein
MASSTPAERLFIIGGAFPARVPEEVLLRSFAFTRLI